MLYEGALAEGVRSPGVSGTYTPEQAVQRLLAGTGSTYRFTDTNTLTIEQAVGGRPDVRGQLDPAIAVGDSARPGTGDSPMTIPEVTVTAEQERGEYRVRTRTRCRVRLSPGRSQPASIMCASQDTP